jgi:ribosomal protein S12 methylthiotransferase accessory factor
MADKIGKCVKKYQRGINKVVAPQKTLKRVLKKIQNNKPKILDSYFQVPISSGIPQFMVMGTDYYSQLVNDVGRKSQSLNANGKGHFKTEALVSGLMEMVERYSCCEYLFRNPARVTTSSFRHFEDGYSIGDFYSNPYYKKRVAIIPDRSVIDAQLRWFKCLSLEGKSCYLPLSLICYTYEYTNGMAAGNSLEEALCHGLCEVIERHCKTVIREGKIATPDIKVSSFTSPIVKDLLEKFKRLNQKVILKDFSLGTGIPAIGVIRKVKKDAYLVTAGVAPHPEEATIRALVENSQIEPGQDFRTEASVAFYLKRGETIDYDHLPNIHNKDIKIELLTLKKLLNKQKMNIFYADTTDKKLAIPSVLVYITNAKRQSSEIGYRNVIFGIIEESFRLKDYRQALKYTTLGIKVDLNNKGLYLYYQGLISAFKSDYKKAISLFRQAIKTRHIYEFESTVNINLAICFFALGQVNMAFGHLLKNVELFPNYNTRLTFIRSHHRFNKKLFNTLAPVYEDLHKKMLKVQK